MPRCPANLRRQVQEDIAKEATVYAEVACFCLGQVDKKAYAIAKFDHKIEELQSEQVNLEGVVAHASKASRRSTARRARKCKQLKERAGPVEQEAQPSQPVPIDATVPTDATVDIDPSTQAHGCSLTVKGGSPQLAFEWMEKEIEYRPPCISEAISTSYFLEEEEEEEVQEDGAKPQYSTRLFVPAKFMRTKGSMPVRSPILMCPRPQWRPLLWLCSHGGVMEVLIRNP